MIVALMRKMQPQFFAFDPKTGSVAWEKERNYKTPPECDHKCHSHID